MEFRRVLFRSRAADHVGRQYCRYAATGRDIPQKMPRRCGFTRSLAQAPPRLESPKQDSFQIESTLPCKVRWGPDQGCLPLLAKDVDFLLADRKSTRLNSIH